MIIGLNCVELDWEGSEEGRSPKQEEGQIKDNLHMSSGFGERGLDGLFSPRQQPLPQG